MDDAQGDLRVRLGALRQETEEAIRSLEARDGPVELDQTVQGRVSRIDAITQQQMARASKARLQLQLARIDAALGRVEDASYGYCNRCEEPIEPRRLQADPAAVMCMPCLTELERSARGP
jgi:DnaK suppressor protein